MYIVFEIQVNADGTLGTLTNTYENQNEAESAYHLKLGSAAVSALPVHSVVILSEEGFNVKRTCYKHNGSTSTVSTEGE